MGSYYLLLARVISGLSGLTPFIYGVRLFVAVTMFGKLVMFEFCEKVSY